MLVTSNRPRATRSSDFEKLLARLLPELYSSLTLKLLTIILVTISEMPLMIPVNGELFHYLMIFDGSLSIISIF